MSFKWYDGEDPEMVQVAYVKQADGKWLLRLAGTDKHTIITHAELIDLLPDVSPQATMGCDEIWECEADFYFKIPEVAV